MFTEVADDRSFKSGLAGIIGVDTRCTKADAATVGFTERGIASEDFDLGILVRVRGLRRSHQARAQKKCRTKCQANEHVLIDSFHDCLLMFTVDPALVPTRVD